MDGWKAVSLHGQRMPWDINSVTSFEDDVWELYHVAEDFSESVNLADQEPKRLADMIAAFDEEAWRYNVYPLYDDMIARLASQQDRLFGDEEEFVYYYPGAIRIAEKVSAPVKGRSHTITATIDLTGDEEGVIVACGGMTGGYAMFIQEGRLVYDYNYLDGVYYELRSELLPTGETTLEFRFELTAPFAGIGHLYVNGEQVDEVEMPAMHFSTYSLQETFDIGQDTGTNVSRHYDDNFHFTGSLDRVVINVPQLEE